jgi:Flp pilus assembly protein TadD
MGARNSRTRDLKVALNYKNLKAMGKSGPCDPSNRSLSMAQARHESTAGSPELIRSTSPGAPAAADDPGNPDWRLISARGTALAKQGKYSEAIPFYERALSLSHDQPSVLSNLALATAMGGDPERAEMLLRRAEAADSASPKIRQNLALVLGLQGKYNEGKLLASRDLSSESAAENTAFLRQVVKLSQRHRPRIRRRPKLHSRPRSSPHQPKRRPYRSRLRSRSPHPSLFRRSRWRVGPRR